MAKKRKALNAKDVVKDPALVDAEQGLHLLLIDRSTSASFENMLAALDLLVPHGWQIVGMSTNLTTSMMQVEMYALLHRAAVVSDGTSWPFEP